MTQPLVELDRSAEEAEKLLDEAVKADAHPGRGTGGWINFTRGWLHIRQARNWEAAEGHMAARYRTEEHAIDGLIDEYGEMYRALHATVFEAKQRLPGIALARMVARLDLIA